MKKFANKSISFSLFPSNRVVYDFFSSIIEDSFFQLSVYPLNLMLNDFDLYDGFADCCETLVSDSLSNYLSWIDTSPIAYVLEKLFPSESIKRWVYPPILLFKLSILQDQKKGSYRKLVSTLTADECSVLGMEDLFPGQFRIPCASTVHHFAHDRLHLDDFKTLMKAIGKLACKHIRGCSGMIFRYDRFNAYPCCSPR